jgi:succinate dehydrogenase flavin-adding protein (antitoxin of CptAB toxin-antitoxin module)
MSTEEIIGSDKELDRVRWAARRGMLELDLVLSPYVEDVYMSLSPGDKKSFLVLLAEEDPDLFCWFIKSQPADMKHIATISKVLKHKENSINRQ